MDSRREALLLWLASVTQSHMNSIQDIRNCKVLEQLLSRIDGFRFEDRPNDVQPWKLNYMRMKSIYDQLQTYMRDTLHVPFPININIMNMVQMAKGQSQDGLQSLLHMIFIVCLQLHQCPTKQEFITSIMRLPSEAQEELMVIVKQNTVAKEQQDEQDNQLNQYKQQIVRIQFQYQNLVADYNGLRAALEQDAEKVRKNQQNMKKMQKDNQNLLRQLAQKTELLRQRQQNYIDRYADHNEQLVDQLKRTLLDRQQHYSQQIMRLKETIQTLNEELHDAKRSNSELIQQNNRRSNIAARDDHINCVSIEKHKLKVNQLLSLSKEATQKEMNVKLENIKLKNINAELELRNKKISQQNRKRQSQFLISSEDGGKLKMQFFTRIRDSLKQKLDQYKTKDNKANSNNKLDFLDDQNE